MNIRIFNSYGIRYNKHDRVIKYTDNNDIVIWVIEYLDLILLLLFNFLIFHHEDFYFDYHLI